MNQVQEITELATALSYTPTRVREARREQERLWHRQGRRVLLGNLLLERRAVTEDELVALLEGAESTSG